MMLSSYWLGQKYYPIPYPVKKLVSYIVMVILIYIVHLGINRIYPDHLWFSLLTATILFAIFTKCVTKIEATELAKIPILAKYFKK